MKREPIALVLAGSAAVAAVVSIAAFEILLGAAVIAISMRREWRWPPVTLPLLAWGALTVLSAAASGDFGAAAPQLRKLFVYLMLFAVYAGVRRAGEVRWIFRGWAAAAALSALWSFEQLARKYASAQAAHQDFYEAYVASRITGFMGHWMTFSGQMMMALILILAVLFFSRDRRGAAWFRVAAVPIACALLAAYTRSMWLGAVAGSGYLIWLWRRWMILAIPVLLAIALLVNPFALRERMLSIVRPRAELDSNQHRAVTRRIGWEIIKAHPLLGIGPEQVGRRYQEFIPADVPRPLPEGYYGHLHNIYIHYAAERGIPAVLALLWALGRMLLDFIRARKKLSPQQDVRWVLDGAIAVMISVLLSGWYELNLGDSEVLAMFLAVCGCAYVVIPEAELAPLASGVSSDKQ